jgi:hypothetical protein
MKPPFADGLLALIEATSNACLCAAVCDAAGMTAIANMSIKVMGLILFSAEGAISVTLR